MSQNNTIECGTSNDKLDIFLFYRIALHYYHVYVLIFKHLFLLFEVMEFCNFLCWSAVMFIMDPSAEFPHQSMHYLVGKTEKIVRNATTVSDTFNCLLPTIQSSIGPFFYFFF